MQKHVQNSASRNSSAEVFFGKGLEVAVGEFELREGWGRGLRVMQEIDASCSSQKNPPALPQLPNTHPFRPPADFTVTSRVGPELRTTENWENIPFQVSLVNF